MIGEEEREKLSLAGFFGPFFTFKFRIWVIRKKKKKKKLGSGLDRRGWMLLGVKTKERIKEGWAKTENSNAVFVVKFYGSQKCNVNCFKIYTLFDTNSSAAVYAITLTLNGEENMILTCEK